MNTPHKNPLLTPFVLPPFDKIQDTDFEPAMIQGIKGIGKRHRKHNFVQRNSDVREYCCGT